MYLGLSLNGCIQCNDAKYLHSPKHFYSPQFYAAFA